MTPAPGQWIPGEYHRPACGVCGSFARCCVDARDLQSRKASPYAMKAPVFLCDRHLAHLSDPLELIRAAANVDRWLDAWVAVLVFQFAIRHDTTAARGCRMLDTDPQPGEPDGWIELPLFSSRPGPGMRVFERVARRLGQGEIVYRHYPSGPVWGCLFPEIDSEEMAASVCSPYMAICIAALKSALLDLNTLSSG